MNGYEKFKINQELKRIREEIEQMKKDRMEDLNAIADHFLDLENKIENLKED